MASMAATVDSESILGEFMNNVIECDILDEAFAGFIKNSIESDIISRKALERDLIGILQSVQPDFMESAIKFYISRTSTIVNYSISRFLFDILEGAILAISHPATSDLAIPKNVCDFILGSPSFGFQNEVFWVNGLNCIRRIIKFINYKGVRDILGILLSKIALIPNKSSTPISKQINALYNLIEYILDRDSKLLPAYLILDEIQKKSLAIVWQNGHWKFSKLISTFVDSFRPVAKIVSNSGRPKILPIVGYSLSMNSLKFDHSSGKFKLKGLLPYDKEFNEPHLSLLLFILEQNNSREAIVNMLSLNKVKGRSPILEKLLVELVIKAITKCVKLEVSEDKSFESYDLTDSKTELGQIAFLWQHVSSTSLYFENIYQNIDFPSFLIDLYARIKEFHDQQMCESFLLKSREFFMWTLLQMLSGYISRHKVDTLEPIFKLFELFYPEREPIPVPSFNKPNCIYIMAAASSWILLTKKAENDNPSEKVKFSRPIPIALKYHIDFMQQIVGNSTLNASEDFTIVLLCNTYSTNSEIYAKAFRLFLDNILGNRAASTTSAVTATPIPMSLLDSLACTTKINLVTHIMDQFSRLAQSKSIQPLPAGMVETYSRLMAYTEIEVYTIKPFLNTLIQNVMRNQCWNYLYTFLELFTYRLHHVNCAYRIQLLKHIFSKSYFSQINHVQLFTCIESTALKIIMGFNSAEFLTLPALIQSRLSDSLSFLPPDSEELHKIFVLSLARAFHITGSETLSAAWVNEILATIKGNLSTNLTWPEYTMKCFPSVISKFYESPENSMPRESNMEQLRLAVDEEYRKWKSMTNEIDMLKHFTAPGAPPLFLCVLYKLLLDQESISTTAYKILDRIGVRVQSVQLRTFADFLVGVFGNVVGERFTLFMETLNSFIWKFHVVPFDRILLCLTLRNFEGNEAQICFFIIQQLMLSTKTSEFKHWVHEFVENSPEHWKENNWANVQAFHLKHPEEYYFKYLQDASSSTTYFPFMFSNLCLRVLPIFDIMLHRLIELPLAETHAGVVADTLLNELGCLYKFHDQPITFLYNTLHYYEQNLRKKALLKPKLVYTIINAFKDVRPRNWAVTETFLNCYQKNAEEDWSLGEDYYRTLIGRLVDTLSGATPCPFQPTDYRFNEFPNATSHALYVTCVEILALPGEPSDIASSIINVVINCHQSFPRQEIELWINAIALILTSLPDSYSNIINERIIDFLKNPQALSDKNLFFLADFKSSHLFLYESEISYLVALSHAYWSHGSIGQICTLSNFLKERIKPIIQTEEQFLFVCYLVGPFLHRFLNERTRCVMDISTELYGMLEIIDKKCKNLKHVDKIADLLYHIKYHFTGNHIQKDIETPIRNMRKELSHKLRFISNVAATDQP